MCKLNHDLADALCAIIACGFIDAMAALQSSGAPANSITDFIYDDRSEIDRYDQLADALARAGIQVGFQNPPSKEKTPFILAKTSKLTADVQQGLQQDMQNWSTTLEVAVDRVDGDKLRGAYLGGYSSVSTTKVLGVSDLYQYKPRFCGEDISAREPELKKAYEDAQAVTNAVVQHLRTFHPAMKKVWPVQDELKLVEEPYQKQHLFASVHGMTRAIARFSPLTDSDTRSVRFELALGSATSKVASCIPCSLLMAAVGQPATATHLGRGDNWNFPTDVDTYTRGKWARYVADCYSRGAEKLKSWTKGSLLSGWFRENEAVAVEKIPDMFLEALTYESAFITKLERALALR